MKRIDLTGKRFGRLTVIKPLNFERGHLRWECLCDCGNTVFKVSSQGLRTGKSQSCGCYMIDRIKEVNSTQNGNSANENRAEYCAWRSAISRCTLPNHQSYKDYGGRGIKVCERWINSFDNFLFDVGKRPTKLHSIDRFPNNDGDYEPSNCRWATKGEQTRGRRNNVWYEHNGEILVTSEWARRLGVEWHYIGNALKKSNKTFTEIYDTIKQHKQLTKEVVLEIFFDKNDNKIIAKKYNITCTIVSDIKRGVTWWYITGKERCIKKRRKDNLCLV